MSRSSHQRCSMKNAVLKNFAILTGKHLCWSFFITKFIKNRLQHMCFPVNIAKFLRTPILRNICKLLLLNVWRWFYCTDYLVRTNHWLRSYVDSKALNLQPWKCNYHSIIRKRKRLKSWNTFSFLRTIFEEHKNMFFTYIIYLDSYPAIFMCRIDSASSFYLKKTFRRPY